MDQPVQHGVGDSRMADVFVPEFNGHLAGDDGGGTIVPVVDDFHQVAPPLGSERGDAPIVEDEEVHPRQALERA